MATFLIAVCAFLVVLNGALFLDVWAKRNASTSQWIDYTYSAKDFAVTTLVFAALGVALVISGE